METRGHGTSAGARLAGSGAEALDEVADEAHTEASVSGPWAQSSAADSEGAVVELHQLVLCAWCEDHRLCRP